MTKENVLYLIRIILLIIIIKIDPLQVTRLKDFYTCISYVLNTGLNLISERNTRNINYNSFFFFFAAGFGFGGSGFTPSNTSVNSPPHPAGTAAGQSTLYCSLVTERQTIHTCGVLLHRLNHRLARTSRANIEWDI